LFRHIQKNKEQILSTLEEIIVLDSQASQVGQEVKNYNLMNNSKLFRTNLCRKYQEE
jgi:hypothetical protein